MSTSHTPGPWRLDTWKYADGRELLTVQTDVDAIAQVSNLWVPDVRAAEQESNARLIAAAPEMLAALKAGLGLAEEAVELRELSDDPDDREMLDLYREHVAAMRAAIHKAEGRGAATIAPWDGRPDHMARKRGMVD